MLVLACALSSLYAIASTATIPLAATASAASINADVRVTSVPPNVTQIRCCFKDYDTQNYADADCRNADSNTPYSPSGGKPYDMTCNITITDINGYQDMDGGWVNVTWHHTGTPWNSVQDNDVLYANNTCQKQTGSESGVTVTYGCTITRIKYWADAGNWTLLANLSDSEKAGTPGKGHFLISNITSIWESSAIDFGSMAPGTNGSQWQPGVVSVNATTNNTGNTIIDIEVASSSNNMACTIGTIPIQNIKYDTSYQKTIGPAPPTGACGQLSSTLEWSASCTPFGLPDCTDTCPGLTYNSIKNTHWGIIIPSFGVGGTCTHTLTIIGVQG